LDRIAAERAKIQFDLKVLSEVGKPPIFSTTYVQYKPRPSFSSTIDALSKHLGGEIPKQ